MIRSGYEGFGSGLGPGVDNSKNPMISMVGPGRSGWSGYFSLFFVGGPILRHRETLLNATYDPKNGVVRKGEENTRTYPDHPDLARVSAGLRPAPYPDPTRTQMDQTRTYGRRHEAGHEPRRLPWHQPAGPGHPIRRRVIMTTAARAIDFEHAEGLLRYRAFVAHARAGASCKDQLPRPARDGGPGRARAANGAVPVGKDRMRRASAHEPASVRGRICLN